MKQFIIGIGAALFTSAVYVTAFQVSKDCGAWALLTQGAEWLWLAGYCQ